MKIFKSKKAQFFAIPAFWWAVTALFSVVGVWFAKKPIDNGGLFGSIPFVGWVVLILMLLVILKSRR